LDKSKGPRNLNDDEDLKSVITSNQGNTIRLLVIDSNNSQNALDQVNFLICQFFSKTDVLLLINVTSFNFI
jgi:hypothetical protein